MIPEQHFYIMQSRSITTLKTPTTKSYLDWKNDELFRWGPIPGYPFYIIDYVEAACLLPKLTDTLYFPVTLLLFHQDQMVWLCRMEEMTDFTVSMFEQEVLDKQKLMDCKRKYKSALKVLTAFEKNLLLRLPLMKSKTEFISMLEKYQQLLINFWLPTIPAEIGNYGAETVLKSKLKRFVVKDTKIAKVLQILTTPEQLTYNQKEEVELAKATSLERHQQKYYFLQNNYSGSKVLDVKLFQQRKKKLVPNIQEMLRTQLAELKKQKQQLITQYKLDAEIQNIMQTVWQNALWQDERKFYSLQSFHVKTVLLERIGELLGISFENLRMYLFGEITKLLQTGQEQTVETSCGFSFPNPFARLSQTESSEAWKNFANQKSSNSLVKKLSGLVACKGKNLKVTQQVTIVFNPHTITEFPEGNILVAPMTSPDYVFLMRQASAVITDTGGLTSHAAILCREMNKPCIVGTKFATQLFKDGDLLEVDVNKGVIKLIKKTSL